MSSLGDRLRQARERKNLKQTQVKERTGIHNKTLSGYENGVSEPDIETIKILADLYEVSIDWLTGKSDDPSLGQSDDLTQEEREFLEILRTDPDSSSFFYDYSKAPAEQRREMIKTWRIIRELEKDRKPGQKQGE